MDVVVLIEKARRGLKTARMAFDDDDMDGAGNRAYYAMFNAARAALLATDQLEAAHGKTHSGLIAAFSLHVVKPGLLGIEYAQA